MSVPMEYWYTPSNHVVFLLGAGASNPFDLPVMTQFMNRARRQYKPSSKSKIFEKYLEMFAFYRACRDASWAFVRDWDNIEELYTQADLLRLMNLPVYQKGFDDITADELCRSISWCIWDVYRQFEGRPPWEDIASKVKAAGLSTTIITTNYDLCPESSLSISRDWRIHYPGFGKLGTDLIVPEMQDSGANTPLPSNQIAIIKLHGSVNWFKSPGGDYAVLNSIQSLNRGKGKSGLVLTYDEVNSTLCKELGTSWDGATPEIIPPMLGKTSDSPLIQSNWRSAINALACAREIYVIGYSFPSTDSFMLRLLTEGLARNEDCQQLVILDYATHESWKDRIATMFEPMFQRQKLKFISIDAGKALVTMCRESMGEWLSACHEKRRQD